MENKNLKVFLPDVSFLFFYKFKDPKKQTGLLYYEVVPYINNNDRTKHKDLRSGKVFVVPKVLRNHPDILMLENEEILKDYGVDPKTNKPDKCFELSYRFAANEIMFSGILEDIAKATNNALPPRHESDEVFVPVEAVVMLANGIRFFKHKSFASNDANVQKEKERQQKILKMRNDIGDF